MIISESKSTRLVVWPANCINCYDFLLLKHKHLNCLFNGQSGTLRNFVIILIIILVFESMCMLYARDGPDTILRKCKEMI